MRKVEGHDAVVRLQHRRVRLPRHREETTRWHKRAHKQTDRHRDEEKICKRNERLGDTGHQERQTIHEEARMTRSPRSSVEAKDRETKNLKWYRCCCGCSAVAFADAVAGIASQRPPLSSVVAAPEIS